MLAQCFGIPAPVRNLSCLSEQHIRDSYRREGKWNIFDKRYWLGHTFGDHLNFVLRHEQIDLLILKRVFEAAQKDETETLVRAAPKGILARREWYLYETLTSRLST